MTTDWEDDDGLSPFDTDDKFRAWLRELEEDVIQEEYGYEPGEFTVYAEHWHDHYLQGLTPAQSFKRALDAFAKGRRMRTDFETLKDGARITLHPHPDNPLHREPVKATHQSGYFYCDGSPPAEGPDYYMGDVLRFNEGYTVENEAATA